MTTENHWEYRLERLGSIWKSAKDEEIQALLDEMGEQGWEVVGFSFDQGKALIIAKRPLSLTTRRQRSMPGY